MSGCACRAPAIRWKSAPIAASSARSSRSRWQASAPQQPPVWNRRRPPVLELPPATVPSPPNPVSKLQDLATEIAAGLEFMAQRFGPPPLRFLTVSPVPGTFGQGFPGLIYLSTMSYVAPSLPSLNPREQVFFSELLHAHETAHQWWGNIVTADGYHDGWLMEALANYTSLLYLEKRKGAHTVESDSERLSRQPAEEAGFRRHGRFRRPDRHGPAPGKLALARRVEAHRVRQGLLDHAYAPPPHGRRKVLGHAGGVAQALRM